MKWKRKKGGFKFSNKKHSMKGIISLAIGIGALAAFLWALYVSSKENGNADIGIGIAGMSAFILTIVGVALGIRGFKEKEILYTFPILGLVFNGALFVTFFIIYFLGISL